jgi:hypothetical protein
VCIAAGRVRQHHQQCRACSPSILGALPSSSTAMRAAVQTSAVPSRLFFTKERFYNEIPKGPVRRDRARSPTQGAPST